jgi:hypothetical protein
MFVEAGLTLRDGNPGGGGKAIGENLVAENALFATLASLRYLSS